MPTATITYTLTRAGQLAAIAAGQTGARGAAVVASVSVEDLELYQVSSAGILSADLSRDATGANASVDAPLSAEAAVALLRALRWAQADRERQREAGDLAELAAYRLRLEAWRVTDHSEAPPYASPDDPPQRAEFEAVVGPVLAAAAEREIGGGPEMPSWDDSLLSHEMRVRLRQRRDVAEAERQVRRDAVKAARVAAEAAQRDRLHEWAVAHGSELLHARIEEGMSWVRLACTEYAERVAGKLGDDWWGRGRTTRVYSAPEAGNVVARETATLEEIPALRGARRCIADRELPVEEWQLTWCTERADDDEAEPQRWAALAAEVRCPDGSAVAIGRELL